MPATAGHHDVLVRAGTIDLPGALDVPPHARGIVVFVHGSGSSRFSPRNQFVARTLLARRCATLLFDLLTETEATDRRNVFDIDLLARRVIDTTAWLRDEPMCTDLPIGYFGASTGAAAALVAAATANNVAAVVSRGGRPDLAGEHLPHVTAPTLLIVGSLDHEVLTLNRQAAARLRCPHKLHIINGATHLFEEPGTLDEAANNAADWFEEHLGDGVTE